MLLIIIQEKRNVLELLFCFDIYEYFLAYMTALLADVLWWPVHKHLTYRYMSVTP